MNKSGYQIIGYMAWKGGRWYLRHRMHQVSKAAKFVGGGALVLGAAGAATAIAYRYMHSE